MKDDLTWQLDGIVDLLISDCALNHHTETNPPAINFIMVEVGGDVLRIPVCKECEEALQGDAWVLLYCINCNRSQWVNKKLSKKLYLYTENEHIKFMKECPFCKGEMIK